MGFLDRIWSALRGLPKAAQILIWLLLFWALVPLLIWRSSLSRGWKTGLSIVFAILLIGIAISPEESTTPVATEAPSAEEAETSHQEPVEESDTVTDEDADEDDSGTTRATGEKTIKGFKSGPIVAGPFVTVTRVVDGDTIEVNLRGRTVDVRLIGIDTPETVHPSEPVECFGPEASNFTSARLSDERVRLEFDVERTDRYGRTLAYVWLDDKLFNRMLVRQGFAQVSTYPPNVKYVERFTAAQRAAREADAGLWGASCPSEEEKTAKPAPGGGGGKNCDPNYTGACIPPYPPDLDCTEISATNFNSVGSDPHGFDGDDDGIACES